MKEKLFCACCSKSIAMEWKMEKKNTKSLFIHHWPMNFHIAKGHNRPKSSLNFSSLFFTSNDGPMVSFDDVPLSCPGFYYPSANTQKKNFLYAPFFRIHENKYLQKTEKSEEGKKRRTNVDRAHTLSIYIISIKAPSIYNISQNKLGWSGYESDYLHHGRTYTLRVSAPFRLLLHPSFMLQVSLK